MDRMHDHNLLPAWLIDTITLISGFLLFRLQELFDIEVIGPYVHFTAEVLGLFIFGLRAYITGMEFIKKKKEHE